MNEDNKVICRAWNKYEKKYLHFLARDGLGVVDSTKFGPTELSTNREDEEGVLLFAGDIVDVVEETISHGDVIIRGVIVQDKDYGWMIEFPSTSHAMSQFEDFILVGNERENPEKLEEGGL